MVKILIAGHGLVVQLAVFILDVLDASPFIISTPIMYVFEPPTLDFQKWIFYLSS